MNKITYITNSPMPTGHAYGYQISKLCETFADSGIETTLVYSGKKNLNQTEIFKHFSLKDNFKLRPIIIFNFFKLEKYIGRLSFYLNNIFFLLRLAFLQIDKDSTIYTRQPDITRLFTFRGFATYYEDHGTTDKKGFIFLKLLRKVKGIVVINNFIKEEFIKNGINSDKILVAQSGVDIESLNADVSQQESIKLLDLGNKLDIDFKDKKVLVYTGNFRTRGVDKGIDEILDSMLILKDPSLVFIAVGGTIPEVDFYEKMSKNLGVKNAFFLPRQSQKELALFQKIADILLMPFPNKAHYQYFMSPVKMFEYMVSKRPIIASSLPSIKEVLNDSNALLVREGSPEDLAEGIKRLLNDKELGVKLAGEAFVDVGRYSWQERVKKIVNFLKNNEKNN